MTWEMKKWLRVGPVESVYPLRDRIDLDDLIYYLTYSERSCLVAQTVKSLPAMQETSFNTWVRQIPWRRKWQLLAWEIPWMEEPGRLQSMGLQTDALFHFKRTCIIFKSKHNIHDYHNCLLGMCVCTHSIMSESSVTPFSPPGFSVHGNFLARILECIVIFFSRGSSWLMDQNHLSCGSCIDRWFFNTEPPGKPRYFIECKIKLFIAIVETVYWKRLNTYWAVQLKKK